MSRNRALTKILVSTGSNKVALQEIADIYQPQTITAKRLSGEGKYPVYGANGIIGKYDQYNHVSAQICITCRGNTCGTVNYTLPFSWITGNSMVINVDNYINRVNKRFLYHLLSTIDYAPFISGSGQPQIVRNSIAKMTITLPDILSQHHISFFLDKLIDRRDIEKSIHRLLIQQKNHLLHNLFI